MGTSYTSPKADWYSEPIERTEIWWIVLAFAWCLFMFFWMIGWHFIPGAQNMNNEAYKTTPEAFGKKVDDFTKKYAVRKDAATGEDVIAPPPGSDVYLAGMQWQWRPIDRKSTRLNSSHQKISYAVFCLKKKKKNNRKIENSREKRREEEGRKLKKVN